MTTRSIAVVMLVEEPRLSASEDDIARADDAMSRLRRRADAVGAELSYRVGVVCEDGEEDVVRSYEEAGRNDLTVMRHPVGDRSAAWRQLLDHAEALGADCTIVLRQGESWSDSVARLVVGWCASAPAEHVLWLPVTTEGARHPITGRRMRLDTARVVAGRPSALRSCVAGSVRERWRRIPSPEQDTVVMTPATEQWRAKSAAELAHDATMLDADVEVAFAAFKNAQECDHAATTARYKSLMLWAGLAMSELAQTPYARLPLAALLSDRIYGSACAKAEQLLRGRLSMNKGSDMEDYAAVMGAAAHYESVGDIDRAISLYSACWGLFGDRAEPVLRIVELDLERAVELEEECRRRGVAADSDSVISAKSALFHARRGLATPLPQALDAIDVDLDVYDRLAFVGGQAALLLGEYKVAETMFERALESPWDEEIVSMAPALLAAARQADAERASALMSGRASP